MSKVVYSGLAAEEDGGCVEISDLITPCEPINISWKVDKVRTIPTYVERAKKCFTGPKSRVILNNVQGIVYGGQMLALMGTSGSGKTSLLNVLNFKPSENLEVHSEVFIHGVKADAQRMSQVSCFVRQDDLFFHNLTVEEHLTIQARLRLSKYTTSVGVRRKVIETLQKFQLENCRAAQIQDISGGEKRRLSFATEILTDPQVLFCDEPTSGLDSHIAKGLVGYLKMLAKSGKTIICTIHQPSIEIFKMFNSICLLSEGNQAFFGSLEDAKTYFEGMNLPCPPEINPADHYLTCFGHDPTNPESSRTIRKRCNEYVEGENRKKIAAAIDSQPRGDEHALFRNKSTACSFFVQFCQLTKRCYKTYFRDTNLILIEMAMALFTGMLGGGVFYKSSSRENGTGTFRDDDIPNVSTTLFYSLMTLSLISTLSAVLAFPSEILIIMREEKVYNIGAYYLAKFVSEFPIYIMKPTIHVLTIYFMVGLGCTAENFFFYLFILILISNAAYALGHVLSAIGGTVNLAITYAAPILAIQILFSGFFLNKVRHLASMFMALKYMSIFHYGYEVLMMNQWQQNTTIKCTSVFCLSDGMAVLKDAKINIDNKWWFILVLFIMVLLYRFSTFVALWFIVHRKKLNFPFFIRIRKSPASQGLIV